MNNSQSTNEEIISLDDQDELTKTVNKELLNEQQKEADENVFLRYLELDPMEGPEAIPAATQRKATGNKSGRTPFTSTKILTKIPKTSFGFSVVWTHPPRVERIEKGSPAEKAGMMPGDYIIFVDKHNVVMMPEVDILNLIKSCGNQLTLEIFRRHPSKNGPSPNYHQANKFSGSTSKLLTSSSALTYHRPSTVGSTHTTNLASVDCNRKRLHLPQVTFSSEKTIMDPEEARRKTLYQIINKEQAYVTELQFGTNRFLFPLAERRDILSPMEHRILFQNLEEILKISEDILDNIVQEDGEQSIQNVPFAFYRKLAEFTTAYRKYCSGIKKADCVLADRTKYANSGFVRFLQTPLIPRKRPDITAFIHRPLQHYRDILNLFSTALGYSNSKHDDYNHLVKIVKEMQVTYRNITKEAGFMEPGGEGRLLLSVQDLENRLVFTKCKPFILNKPGRHWIFGGELFRVEGRNIRQYWTLLFTDILLFAKVSRDRVLFITEEPLPLSYIAEIIFTVRKKSTEFRLLVQPGGASAKSPTVHCGLDITKAPRKQGGKRCIVLRAPNIESKAIWQNLLQRQIFRVNSGMESSTFSSPLESPEVPLNFSAATLQSTDSLSNRRQNAQYSSQSDPYDSQKQIHELIEHKCKQLGKTGDRGKGTAIHLEHWMKNQLTSIANASPDDEPIDEIWSEEQLRKRTQELLSGDSGRTTERNESRCEKMEFSDVSPSKSTSFESQVTVKSSPVGQGSVKVCKQCQKTCLTNSNNNIMNNNYLNNHDNNDIECGKQQHSENHDNSDVFELVNNECVDRSHFDQVPKDLDLDNANIKNNNDPFLPIPRISVNPPTPDMRRKVHRNNEDNSEDEQSLQDQSSDEQSVNENNESDDDDESQDNFPSYDEQPYHVLSKSNPNLRRYGTLSSLKKLDSQEIEEEENSDSDESDEQGIDNEGFNHSTIRSWTSRAGAYVSEKIAFFERLGEDYKTGAGFFERYLKTTEVHEEECENSAATSGEEVWGTPTSGGDLDDPSVYSNCDGQRSLSMDSGSSENDDDAELIMDELLMTPPVASVNIRGLLPRTTLEPLMEEDSDTCTSSSSSTAAQSPLSKQGNVNGTVADACSIVVKKEVAIVENHMDDARQVVEGNPKCFTSATSETQLRIHRSESYRNIIDAEDEGVGFFRRLNPTLVKIENVNKCRSIRLLEILNVRKGERKIYETFPTETEVIKLFSKEGSTSHDVPTTYGRQPPFSPKKPKDKPSDRRFWRQLSRRRGSKAMDSGT
ncbi:uncharacterized protein LOC108734687 isoform X2 [Agrilus planipennis]|nr:uncharacterized protein LOC108734687 isoform X2 [Agrilus planipennis]